MVHLVVTGIKNCEGVLYRIHHCYRSSSIVHDMLFKRETESLVV